MIKKSFADHRYMRKAALWFVIPACVCVAASLLDVIVETSFFTLKEEVETAEIRLKELKKDLLPDTTVCYISNSPSISAYYRAVYVLSPVIINNTLVQNPLYLIYDCVDPNQSCQKHFVTKGYKFKKEYKNGIKLYERESR